MLLAILTSDLISLAKIPIANGYINGLIGDVQDYMNTQKQIFTLNSGAVTKKIKC